MGIISPHFYFTLSPTTLHSYKLIFHCFWTTIEYNKTINRDTALIQKVDQYYLLLLCTWNSMSYINVKLLSDMTVFVPKSIRNHLVNSKLSHLGAMYACSQTAKGTPIMFLTCYATGSREIGIAGHIYKGCCSIYNQIHKVLYVVQWLLVQYISILVREPDFIDQVPFGR